MIVGIATMMAIKMTKIPWRVFDCSSKLPLSPSSDVGDFEHPDALLLRLRVDKVTSRPSLFPYLWRGKFTNCDLFKPKTFTNGISTVCQFANIKLYLLYLFYTWKNFSILTSQEHVNEHHTLQKIEIECETLNWLTRKSRKHNQTRWRTSEEKLTTLSLRKNAKSKDTQQRRKSSNTWLFVTESLKAWIKFLREKPDYSGNKTKTSLFVGGVIL